MQLRIGALLAAAVAFVSISAAAEEAEVAQAPPPDWVKPSPLLAVPEDANGLVFVRAQDSIVHLDGRRQSTYTGLRVKLLHPQALQMGNLAISWNPAAGSPAVHALRIHRGDKVIDVLGATKFEILRREDQLEAAMLTGILTAVLRVPDLRVGDELEFAYTVPSSDPTLGDRDFGLLYLASAPAPGRFRLALNWEGDQKPQVRPTADIADSISQTGNTFELRIDNPPTVTPPKDAPPRYGWQRVIEYSDFPSWNAVSQRMAPLFAEAASLSLDSPLREEAAQIAAAHSDPLERAQAALELVQQQVRYVYVGLGGGNYTPATADETWQRRYGDCKGKTALLLALLAQLEIDAEPVLVNSSGSDDGLDGRLPNPGLFDHVLVRAKLAGKTYWLDGTLPAVATASEKPDFPYRWVLPLPPKGAALEELALTPATEPAELQLYELDARAGIDEPARIVTTSIRRGPAALLEYMQFSALTSDQLLQAFRSTLTGSSQWNTVESVRYRYDVPARASVLEIEGTGPINWDSRDSHGRSLALPGGGFSPPSRRQRAADQDQSAPFYNQPEFGCSVTTVRLPKDTDPGEWDYNSTFDASLFGRIYYRMMERRGETFRMVRGSRIERTEISPAQATRDNARIESFDNSKAVLYYTPGRSAPEPRGMTPVPATWEGDWVHSAQFCLPEDLRS
jgi:transglutaminase-like putative cysteine protease